MMNVAHIMNDYALEMPEDYALEMPEDYALEMSEHHNPSPLKKSRPEILM